MEEITLEAIFIYIVLPVVGISLISSAVIWRKSLSGQEVVAINLPKLGAQKANAFGLLVLLGFVLISVAPFFFYQRYADKLKTQQGRIEGLETKLTAMDETIKEAVRELEDYDLRLTLIFPENDRPRPFNAKAYGYLRKKDETVASPYTWRKKPDKGAGGIVVYFDNLASGDKLYVIVEDDGKRWRSDDMVMPKAQLKMNSME